MCCKKAAWLIQKVRERPLIFFALLHAILFMAVSANLDNIVGNCYTAHLIASNILEGQVPYHDFFSEYPPLAVLASILPGLLTSTQPLFSFFFALEIFLIDVAIIVIMAKFANSLNMSVWKAFVIYTLCLVAVGSVVTGRYDLLPAALALLALYAFVSGRNKTAWALLALGVMAKVYPIIIAPLFVLYLLRYRQYRRLAQGITIFLAVVLIVSLPWLIIDTGGYWDSISYHLERGLHSESSYGSVLLVGQIMGLTQTTGEFRYGSWNLDSPMADNLAQVSTYITIGLLLLAYALYARRLWQESNAVTPPEMTGGAVQSLLRYSMLAILIMLLGSKLFSPQFIIWLCPLLPLVEVRWRYALLVLFLVVGGLTQYIYPHHYLDFEYATLGSEPSKNYLIVMLFIRNFLLLVMAIILLLPLPKKLRNREQQVVGPTPSGRV